MSASCLYICIDADRDANAVSTALAAARRCLEVGHTATLLVDADVPPPAGIALLRLRPQRPKHLYLCPEHAAADRVYDTLLVGGWSDGLATAFFVGCGHAALTTLRARRLLGRFSDLRIVVLGPTRDTADPGTVAEVFTRWAAGYARAHADAVLAVPHPPGQLPHERPTPPTLLPHARISVVIPLFNQGRFLHDAIASVRAQDAEDVEIVVVNAGSTDAGTNRMFAELHGVVKVTMPDRGLSATRNEGIRRATGDYVVPLDADDMLSPGFLTAARDALRRNPDLGYLVGNACYIGLLDLTYVPAGFIPELNLFLHTHGKATGMYRRSTLDTVGGYDEDCTAFGDWEIQIALHRAGQATDVLPLDVQYYRRHAESMSFTTSNAIRDELIQQLIRKHYAVLAPEAHRTALLVLTHLWKTGYEPSPSVLLQRRTS